MIANCKDCTLCTHLRTEILNYLGPVPGSSNLPLKVGKLLIWISGKLDAGTFDQPIAKLGEAYREDGLLRYEHQMDAEKHTVILRRALNLALLEIADMERRGL